MKKSVQAWYVYKYFKLSKITEQFICIYVSCVFF